MGGDNVVEKLEGGKLVYVLSKGSSRKQRLRDHTVTEEKELLHVKRANSGVTVPVFLAPDTIEVLDCAGDKIAVGCKKGRESVAPARAGAGRRVGLYGSFRSDFKIGYGYLSSRVE